MSYLKRYTQFLCRYQGVYKSDDHFKFILERPMISLLHFFIFLVWSGIPDSNCVCWLRILLPRNTHLPWAATLQLKVTRVTKPPEQYPQCEVALYQLVLCPFVVVRQFEHSLHWWQPIEAIIALTQLTYSLMVFLGLQDECVHRATCRIILVSTKSEFEHD